MKEFKKFYVWGMNAKFYMGIYFAALVFLSGLVTAISGGDSLKLIHLLQMLLLAMVVALAQVLLLEGKRTYNSKEMAWRSGLWVAGAAGATVICALAFGWMEGLGGWCPYLLGLFMTFGCCAMLIGLKFERDADTVHLERELETYKKSGGK
ncbi:hypothetical protein KQI82_07830 [Oscillibacter sp. MSJ-2]|uniref:DUF3021 domain-containing protein n=1 Tax=Dysosmobacter acutus TaxID=2841504 RepID=A0ABS6F950_9FIRM|nr:hypothetical protein [Dysosmobacter acutus]MBU5626822.1 hypothetical protein [Dysosmobacter acutus]